MLPLSANSKGLPVGDEYSFSTSKPAKCATVALMSDIVTGSLITFEAVSSVSPYANPPFILVHSIKKNLVKKKFYVLFIKNIFI